MNSPRTTMLIIGLLLAGVGWLMMQWGWRKSDLASSRVIKDFYRILAERPQSDPMADPDFREDDEDLRIAFLGLFIGFGLCFFGAAICLKALDYLPK